MNGEVVKIKGTRAGLQLLFAAGTSFDEIKTEIEQKLSSGSAFFCRGTVVHAMPDSLPQEDMEVLRKLFHDYGVIFKVEDISHRLTPNREQEKSTETPQTEKAASTKVMGDQATSEPAVQQMVVINRTLRGGQEIRTRSSVLICGNVNPGAQVIAGGSIDIRGTCRGLVHAGAYGNKEAFVIADHLMPTQIRIAELIARAPDHMEESSRAEKASIKDGQIVIEPIDR